MFLWFDVPSGTLYVGQRDWLVLQKFFSGGICNWNNRIVKKIFFLLFISNKVVYLQLIYRGLINLLL